MSTTTTSRKGSIINSMNRRRYSTASTSNIQDNKEENTLQLRQKLALLRGRVQQKQQPSPAAQVPSPQNNTLATHTTRTRTTRRSSLTALTASARAKQVLRNNNNNNNNNDHSIKKSSTNNGDTNDNINKRPINNSNSNKKLNTTKLPRLLSTSPVQPISSSFNEPEPNHYSYHQNQQSTTTTVATTTASATTKHIRPRSKSVKTDMGTVRRNNSRKQKECCKNMTSASPSRSPSFTTNTKTCTPNNEEKLVDLNRRLLAALLDDDYNNNSNYNDDAKSTPPAPEDRITLFPEDEDEPIIKISKVEKARSQRRKSMPAVKNVKTSTYVDENSKPDPGFWNELVDIKSRLQKLEVQNEFEDNNCNIMGDSNSNSTTTTHTTTIASVFDKQHQHQQQPLSPLSSSNNTISSSPLQPRISVHQKRLQDAFAIFEHKQQYTSTKPNPMLKSMATVIAETISINQKLWAAIPQDLGTDARSLVALQKSSDTQLRELTESIYLLGSECEQPVDPIILPRYQHQSSRRQSQIYSPPALNVIEDPILVAQQQQQYIPPSPATTATRPSSQYYYTNMEQQIQSPRSRPSSYFHTSSNNVSSYQHLIKPLQQQQQQQQQTVNNNNNTAPLSSSLDVHSPRNSIRPIKVAGILDYSTNMNGSTTGIQQQHQTMGGIDQHHYYYHHSNNNNSRPTSKYYDPYHQRYTSGGTISLYDDL